MLASLLAVDLNINRAKGAPRVKTDQLMPRYIVPDTEPDDGPVSQSERVRKAMETRNALFGIATSRWKPTSKPPKWMN